MRLTKQAPYRRARTLALGGVPGNRTQYFLQAGPKKMLSKCSTDELEPLHRVGVPGNRTQYLLQVR